MGATFKNDGSLFKYYGSSIGAIIAKILAAVDNKSDKARRRIVKHHFDKIDLCVLVQDGSLMDLHSYQISDFDFSNVPFENIFFITPSYFFRYTKTIGFQEYQRII